MPKRFLFSAVVVGLLAGGFYLYQTYRPGTGARGAQVFAWIRNPSAHPELAMHAGARCGNSPFIFPTDGAVGFIWGDSFRLGHHHQGVDIFAGTQPDVTAIVAAYPGYLTRLPEWKSSVIVRVPSDPLHLGRQIWLYYTHMADPDGNSFISAEFPAGTFEKEIPAGVLLGYQGDYSGDPNNPVGVHLHFSIVEDDGTGHFKNELDINNTYDPSPYLGLRLNARENRDSVPVCEAP
jgi:hypothetical protein